MKLNEYLNQLDRKIALLEQGDWMRPIVQDAHAEHVKQIFTEGEDSSGKKEKYKPGSYKSLREKRGRQTNFVDLVFEGDLFRDYANSLIRLNGAWVTGTKRVLNSLKIDGMIDLYGEEKFKLQQDSINKYKERIRKKITEILD